MSDINKFVKGKHLHTADFLRREAEKDYRIKTGAGSAVGDAIAAAVGGVSVDPPTAQETADAIAADAGAQATLAASLVDDFPDTAKTVRGFVNLTDLQQMGDGRKVFDENVHVGNGNPAHAGRATVTAVGFEAGLNNTGAEQSALGRRAGLNNTGVNQTAIGSSAGQNNTGVNQTAIGFEAGLINTGARQTAIGSSAGASNTGVNQTAIGRSAGQINTGLNQTAIGSEAGLSNTGLNQTAIGSAAGENNTGDNNSFFGAAAGTAVGLAFTNVTVLGANAHPTASNQVMLGSGAVTAVRSTGTFFGAGFTTTSDATLKEDVVGIDPAKALEFRNGLQWKRFTLFSETQTEVHEEQTVERDGETETVTVHTGAYQTTRTNQGVQYGLIAQDVQALTATIGDFGDVVVNLGEYFVLDAQGFPTKDKKGNPVKKVRLGLNYDAVNVIVMAGEQAALAK